MDYLLDIGALISGFWLLWYGFSVWRMKSLMENIAGSKLGSVAMGYAEVCGEARGDYPLKSPITFAPCVYYRYKIEQLAAGQGRRSGWRVVREGSSDNPFHLGDETGSILVDPADAELLLTPDYQYRDETEMTKYTEWKIMAGDRIYVVGTVRPQRDRASERKERLLERLREARKDRERLSSYDADRDGQISMEEWDRLKGDVEADLLAEELSQGEKEEGYVIAEGDGGPFVISNRSEAELTQRLMLKSLLCLAGGFILIMVMVASLLGRSGVLSMPFSFPWPIILRGS